MPEIAKILWPASLRRDAAFFGHGAVSATVQFKWRKPIAGFEFRTELNLQTAGGRIGTRRNDSLYIPNDWAPVHRGIAGPLIFVVCEEWLIHISWKSGSVQRVAFALRSRWICSICRRRYDG
jgi:hypothetical protein